jgi:transposase InsO family protein
MSSQCLHSCGIVTSTTSAGSTESNGIAERAQGVLKRMMRPDLLASGVAPALSSESHPCPQSSPPHRSLHENSPNEILHGVLPDRSKFRI